MQHILSSFLVAAVSVGSIFYLAYNEAAARETEFASFLKEAHQSAAVARMSTDVRHPHTHEVAPRTVERKVTQAAEELLGEQVIEKERQETRETKVVEEEYVEGDLQEMVVTEHVNEDKKAQVSDANQEEIIEQLIFSLTNEIRSEENLLALESDPLLDQIAMEHSAYMASTKKLTHADTSGCALTCRLENNEYVAQAWAENIAQLHKAYLLTDLEVAKRVVESWLQSGPHRKNLLSKEYARVGIGVVIKGDMLYVTADYAFQKR